MLGNPIKSIDNGHASLATERWRGVDGASLAIVRIAVGVIGAVSMVRLAAYGWVDELYAAPQRRFHYPGLWWLQPPGRIGTWVLVAVVGLAACAVAVGRCYRLCVVVFVVGFSWIEFLDVTTYLNHYWFVTLLGMIMIVGPFDAALVAGRPDRCVQSSWVTLVRFQVGLVYAFAGLAKLHPDWLLDGQPLRMWLAARGDVPIVGSLLTKHSTAVLAGWAGALFDCLVVPALLWRRTRAGAWVVLVIFHIVTWLLFQIGVFPWLMIAASTIFFAPGWPRRMLRRQEHSVQFDGRPWGIAQRVVALTWVVLMLAVPLRHWLIPGDARWTGEGYRFAWNVLLTERSGDVRFTAVDRVTGRRWVTDATDLYTHRQWAAMSTDAELIRQAAHDVASRFRQQGHDVAVYVDAFLSLNGRPPVRFVDPEVDLAGEPWTWTGQPWILDAGAPLAGG